MATYKEIRGTQIEAVATDPSNPVEGQVWYNTTSNALKGLAATTTGSWATGGALNQTRYSLAGAGLQTAGLAFGGYIGPPGSTANTEQWNGASWTELNNLNTARNGNAGDGTITAAISFGGNGPPITGATEEWSSSSISTKTVSTD